MIVRGKDVVIFRAGTWNGEEFTETDLDNMVQSFSKDQPIPLIIGHSSDYKGHTRIPSYGQITGGLKRVGTDLIAMGVEFTEKLASWIKEGFFLQRSVEMTKDNKRILAVGMLGAAPPAVSGMPPMDEALTEISMEYSDDVAKNVKAIEFAKPPKMTLDELKAVFTDDTFEQLSEACQKFMTTIGTLMEADEPDSYVAQDAIYALQSDLQTCMGIHTATQTKIDAVKQSFADKVAEMAKKLFNHKTREVIVDTQKEKELNDKILALETANKEFAEKERVAKEAQAKAEADAADNKIKGEIKVFTDQMKTEGKYVEADEKAGLPDLMFTLAKAGKSYKEFFAGRQIVPVGVLPIDGKQDGKNDERPKVIQDAAQYVKDHPKEFSGLDEGSATARAVYLHSVGKIKFTGK